MQLREHIGPIVCCTWICPLPTFWALSLSLLTFPIPSLYLRHYKVNVLFSSFGNPVSTRAKLSNLFWPVATGVVRVYNKRYRLYLWFFFLSSSWKGVMKYCHSCIIKSQFFITLGWHAAMYTAIYSHILASSFSGWRSSSQDGFIVMSIMVNGSLVVMTSFIRERLIGINVLQSATNY